MMDSTSVITAATKGFVDKMARENEISIQAQYARLGPDCVYPKARLLIRQIARLNPAGAELIRLDLENLFTEILSAGSTDPTDPAEFHQALTDAVQIKLAGGTRAERLAGLRHASAVIDREIRAIEHE